MPEELERKLKKQAKLRGFVTKKGKLTEQGRAYVYGTLRKTGWRPSREK